MKRRIGFLGGTFNPIHNGHLLIAESAREDLELEKVIFIPSGCSYMKSDIIMPDGMTRLAMTQLAIRDNPFFELSDMEVARSGNTYTFETLEQLAAEYPETELVFIVGADTLFMMEHWKEPGRIFAKAIIAAAVREDKNSWEVKQQMAYLREAWQADIRLLPVKNYAFSSTQIRAMAAAGQSLRYLIPEAVRDYMLQHQIYGAKG